MTAHPDDDREEMETEAFHLIGEIERAAPDALEPLGKRVADLGGLLHPHLRTLLETTWGAKYSLAVYGVEDANLWRRSIQLELLLPGQSAAARNRQIMAEFSSGTLAGAVIADGYRVRRMKRAEGDGTGLAV